MKKFIALFLSSIVCVTGVTGCTGKPKVVDIPGVVEPVVPTVKGKVIKTSYVQPPVLCVDNCTHPLSATYDVNTHKIIFAANQILCTPGDIDTCRSWSVKGTVKNSLCNTVIANLLCTDIGKLNCGDQNVAISWFLPGTIFTTGTHYTFDLAVYPCDCAHQPCSACDSIFCHGFTY